MNRLTNIKHVCSKERRDKGGKEVQRRGGCDRVGVMGKIIPRVGGTVVGRRVKAGQVQVKKDYRSSSRQNTKGQFCG